MDTAAAASLKNEQHLKAAHPILFLHLLCNIFDGAGAIRADRTVLQPSDAV